MRYLFDKILFKQTQYNYSTYHFLCKAIIYRFSLLSSWSWNQAIWILFLWPLKTTNTYPEINTMKTRIESFSEIEYEQIIESFVLDFSIKTDKIEIVQKITFFKTSDELNTNWSFTTVSQPRTKENLEVERIICHGCQNFTTTFKQLWPIFLSIFHWSLIVVVFSMISAGNWRHILNFSNWGYLKNQS